MGEEGNKNFMDAPVELESQFILRLPPTAAAQLRAAVRSGVSDLEERLQIQLEADMRHATVQFDRWTFSAKLYDLPAIVESCKTLDGKIFYKTADICQIMIAQEGEPEEESVSPQKKGKEKARWVLPHGLTPPLKNVRKRRFRKTLKKKYVDLPDVEKEVKRLLRTDTEAISVRYEVLNADDERMDGKGLENLSLEERELSNSQAADVAEYDLFGEVLSCSSEESEEEEPLTIRPSITREDSNVGGVLISNGEEIPQSSGNRTLQQEEECATEQLGALLQEQKTAEERAEQLDALQRAIASLQAKRRAHEVEIEHIENQALRQRFQASIDRLQQEIYEKQLEYNEIFSSMHEG